MKIESSTLIVKDDHGIVIEVKPLIEVPSEEASKEVLNFFSIYRIVTAHKEINPIDKRKLELGTPKKVDESKKVRPAELLPINQLEYIVKNFLPKEFCRKDFITYINSKSECDGCTSDDKQKMWISVYMNMKINKKLTLIGKEGRKRDYKYRYIGIDNPEDVVKEKVEMLKNGETVKL